MYCFIGFRRIVHALRYHLMCSYTCCFYTETEEEELGKAEARTGRALCRIGDPECLSIIGRCLQRLSVDCRVSEAVCF